MRVVEKVLRNEVRVEARSVQGGRSEQRVKNDVRDGLLETTANDEGRDGFTKGCRSAAFHSGGRWCSSDGFRGEVRVPRSISQAVSGKAVSCLASTRQLARCSVAAVSLHGILETQKKEAQVQRTAQGQFVLAATEPPQKYSSRLQRSAFQRERQKWYLS